MSEVLARIRVREIHGIRRFLYPLMAVVELPEDTNTNGFQLTQSNGVAVPTELEAWGYQVREGFKEFQFGFAVSLAPLEELELHLFNNSGNGQLIDDPLNVQWNQDGVLESIQKRFSISVAKSGDISYVMYDGVSHLKSFSQICVNGFTMPGDNRGDVQTSPLSWDCVIGDEYQRSIADGGKWQDFVTRTQLTASANHGQVGFYGLRSRSRAMMSSSPLPLAITSPTLTCDFGVGGYVFGKLDEKATEIVWHTEFGEASYAKWTVATAGRVDYVGEVATAEEFRSQRWFHLIDSDKALAVAITILPDDCREMTVRLTHAGDVSVAFKLGDTVTGPVEFGVCYHFLNDVPAIAAATNPQSILLPPLVEVLPV